MDIAINADAPTGIFNVASGEAHSIKEIFDLVADYLCLGPEGSACRTPLPADDVPIVSLDATETLRVFGW